MAVAPRFDCLMPAIRAMIAMNEPDFLRRSVADHRLLERLRIRRESWAPFPHASIRGRRRLRHLIAGAAAA